jgi:hypothetical protein
MQRVTVYFSGEEGWVQNLGDALVPHLLRGLGVRGVGREVTDATVLNPGRCLLVIGSLVTSADLRRIDGPIDVWGCGWKGMDAWEGFEASHVRFHAVRGPLTAAGVSDRGGLPLGDPALLLPYLFPRPSRGHGRSVLLQHLDRVQSSAARERAMSAGCDEVRSPYVYGLGQVSTILRTRPGQLLYDLRRWVAMRPSGVLPLWETIDRIAGASFVLTGSLHGAILAQAFGVPWAAFDDGCIDTPAKWRDWAAYLGVSIAFMPTLERGRQWWSDEGHRGRIRDLAPLVAAFPYLDQCPPAQHLLARLRNGTTHGERADVAPCARSALQSHPTYDAATQSHGLPCAQYRRHDTDDGIEPPRTADGGRLSP